MRFWPRTLGMQMMVVMAAAVTVSNLGVAAWFELGNERQNQNALMDRVLDRAVSTSTLLGAIPEHSWVAATKTMSSGVW